jgi:integrase/recombinase XerD
VGRSPQVVLREADTLGVRIPIYTNDPPGDILVRALPLEPSVLPCPALDQTHRYGPTRDPVRLYLARLSPGSRRVMASALQSVATILSRGLLDAETVPWHHLRYEHVQAVRASLLATLSPKTGKPLAASSVNRTLCAVRGVLKECWRLGLISAEELARAADVERAPGNSLPTGRCLDIGEITALFAACQRDTSPAGARDAALLALGYAGGLRRAEICNLDVAHYSQETGRMEIHGGKGNKDRVVFLRNGAADAIAAWFAFRGDEPGPLLCPVSKSGKIEIRRLTGDTVYRVTLKRGKKIRNQTLRAA